jgi:catechol 2,3-dioxygenase-like lactoylglutathione lyase family enzyme
LNDPPHVTGILETCIYVEDVGTSRAFYRRLFGFNAMTEDDRIAALDVGPGQVLILFKRGGTREPVATAGGVIPPHDGSGEQHFAFAIGDGDYKAWIEHLHANQVDVESEVTWPRGGRSLYFRDPDGLLIELATPGLWRNY